MKAIVVFLAPLILVFATGATYAADEPTPVARFTFDEATCHKRIKNMSSMIKYWSPGGVHNYYLYDARIIPYWEFIGDMYYNGCPKGGLDVDRYAAAQWYQSAAIEFVPSAQYKLGRMMIEGDGTPVNLEGGRAWITSAALEGSREAAQYLAHAGLPVPQPINPTSYTIALREAKAELEAGQARDRAAIVSDLSNLVVNIAAAYVAVNAAAATAPVARRVTAQPPATPPNFKPIMRRPQFCNTYGTATPSAATSTVWVNVSTFCN